MTERSQFRLLGERRFGPFFATQLLGAFNDNVFKNALVILIAFQAAGLGGLAPEVTVNLAAGLFILPFFLFSATAGQLADKYDKARIMRLVKLAEIGIMAIAAVGFVRGDVVTLFAALFLMGVHSTVFGPAKYSILPQALDEQELVGGNALVETGTWAAILAGTILGGLLIARPSGPTLLVPAVTIGVAVLG
ncbi:MAG: MFS transporter, partial [Burkholderiales bacterium]